MSDTTTNPTVEELLSSGIRDQAAFAAEYPEGIAVKVRHGLFSYFESREGLKNDGTWGELLTEQYAMYNETAHITKLADYIKGVQLDAFYSDKYPDPTVAPPPVAEEETEEVELEDLDDEELVDWFMGTGRFDGEKKPTEALVLEAAGDDHEFAQRLIAAEKTASGDNPRTGLIAKLEKIA